MSPDHVERTLWQVVRDGHVAEARVRQLRTGFDLRILAGGELIWWRGFSPNPESEHACERAAAALLETYQRDGWQLVDPWGTLPSG